MSRHVIISGGARGLGLGFVKALLEAGYSVSTFSRRKTNDVAELLAGHPDAFGFWMADVTDSDKLTATVREAQDRFGPVYGVVNNAAISVDGVLATLPEVEVSRMLAVNLEGAIRLTRLCVRSMLRGTGGGRIVNISSIVGQRGYNGLAVYSATKAGLDGFTRSLARELGRRGIAVNSIAPGYMRTEMSMGLSEEQLGQIVRRTPMSRLAVLEDIIPLLLFLLSDDAAFITGQTIIVDGGISA